MRNADDRRKHKRADYSHPLRVQTVAPLTGNVSAVKSKTFSAKGQNVSEGGFGVELSQSFKPGSILKIYFKIKIDEPDESEAYVTVVWAHQAKHGFQFLMLKDSTLQEIRELNSLTL